jgi:hypothetical protein
MIIVYESKTGFTKKYAEMLAAKTGMKLYNVNELSKNEEDEIVFLGWLKAGKIQGLNKARKFNVVAVCATGTGSAGENDSEAIIKGNNLGNIPFFYVQGGCLPLKSLKGMDRFLMSLFVKMLKKQNTKDGKYTEAINRIENGFDGVREENLVPLMKWLNTR